MAPPAEDMEEESRILLAKGKITQLATTRRPGRWSHYNGISNRSSFDSKVRGCIILQEKQPVSKQISKNISIFNKFMLKNMGEGHNIQMKVVNFVTGNIGKLYHRY